MQFSLRLLFVVTTVAALATLALIYATPLWAELWFTVCVVLLLASVLFSAASEGRGRFFWAGFALFGWGYWLILHSPVLDMDADFNNWRLNPESPPPLITSRCLGGVYHSVLPLVHEAPTAGPGPLTTPGPFVEPPRDAFGYAVRTSTYPTEIEFMRVGHSLFDVLFALLGGLIGSLAYQLGRRPRERC